MSNTENQYTNPNNPGTMKKTVFTLLMLTFLSGFMMKAFAQYPEITIKQLQYVSPEDLASCNDTSSYFNDTVTVVGVVVADANLIDVPSSSVQGKFRPFVHIMDTANGGQGGDFHGVEVMGVYSDASGNQLPVNDVYNLYAGMIVKVTGIVHRYLGETEFDVLNNSSITVLGSMSKPEPIVVDLGKLNDNTRTNKLPTGEEFEGSFVELQNLTVTAIYNFSGNRVSFDVTDQNGNVMNVSDQFFVQKTSSYTTTRSSAPQKQGSFKAPVVGTKFDYIRGIILHSENGCTGNSSGRGYEIDPFDASHYKIGVTPPSITEIVRTPLVPKDNEKVTISAKIVDFDGTVQSAKFYYSANMSDTYDKFTEVVMTLKSGTTDTYLAEIPMNSEGTVVRYYISSTDDANQTSYAPFAANSTTDPDFMFYTVRNGGLAISDVQKVLSVTRDASPFLNQVVTVTGVVTASAKSYDLESIYIQDPNETEWAGIKCQGNSDLIKLYRGEEVTVTGTVAESFGFTVLNVTKVVKTGNDKTVSITTIDPSDSAFYNSHDCEKYEGMLVGLINKAGGKIYVSNPKLSAFGEYLVSTNENASYGKSRRIQAGIQNTNNASSLWVSLVSDTALKSTDGAMNVPAIAVTKGMSFDTIVGMFYYGFSNYSILPRNNDDFKGSSVTLEPADYPQKVSVANIAIPGVNIYPNPATDHLNVDVPAQFTGINAVIYGIDGKRYTSNSVNGITQIDVQSLNSGMYILRLEDSNGQVLGSVRWVKN
ncbi:MAG: T9SS type A sorting domain-containing protein [Bacteroidetes bacterium]|nr:T9SS type A sorting domain-containing protein [Bacteroidota bacterium]